MVYSSLQDLQGKNIAEIGGGDSRILRVLGSRNRCYNIEKFEGVDGGPSKEIIIDGVENIHAFVGEWSDATPKCFFDVVFSVSVVEHVPQTALGQFLEEGVEMLKPGGLWVHAIDLYLENEPSAYWQDRYEQYRQWLDHPKLQPVGEVVRHTPLRFHNDMASNPDHVMYKWGRIAPALNNLRQVAQSVSLFVSLRKKAQ